MSDQSPPSESVSLGRAVSARFQPMHARRRTRIALDHRAGVVARKSAQFGFLNGRSILARRVMGQNVSAQVAGTELLPVGMQLDMWLAIAERERTRMRPTPSRLEQSMQAAQRRVMRSAASGFAAETAAAGPRGLPRATSRGRLSPAGVDTGPSSATHRMVTEAAFVANPDEVRAAGPMLGRRDLARAVARRSTVGPPSPSTGGGRARRSAQASGPGRQVGATRPDADAVIARLAETPTSSPASSATSRGPGVTGPGLPLAARLESDGDDRSRADLASAASTMPRALSLPPTASNRGAGLDEYVPWQPLPRPGAVARRGALASELRRAPREVRGATWTTPLPTGGLVVAPTVAAASYLTAGVSAQQGPAVQSGRSERPGGPTAAPRSASSPAAARSASTSASGSVPTSVPASAPTSSSGRAVAPIRRSPAVAARAGVAAARFGPAVPASLLRGRVLRAAPASAVGARVIGRATRQQTRSSIRPSSFATPSVSTLDRQTGAQRVVSIGNPARALAYTRAQSSQSPSRAATPVLRSMADALQRVTRTSERSLADATAPALSNVSPSQAAVVRTDATHAVAAGLPLTTTAPATGATPMSMPSTTGLPMSTAAAATAATPMPMPSRLAEAPVPSLPMAAAFAQRAVTERSQPLLPIAARARATQEVRRASLGRVTTIPSATNPTGPRTRFGRNIAPVAAKPSVFVQPSVYATPAAQFRPAGVTSSSVVSLAGASGGVVTRSSGARSFPAPAAGATGTPSPVGSIPTSISSPSLRAEVSPAYGSPSGPGATHELRRSIGAPETAAPMTPAAAMAPSPSIPGVAPASAGARFLAALREAPADPIRPVPAAYAPLARAIAGPKPVAVRAGAATTRALRTVGKRAATVDNVVHLDASPSVSLPSTEVFAHELVHAARPSPIPRFFDDDHHSPEEDLARATGNLMRAVQPPSIAGAASAADTIRRMQSNDSRMPTFGTAGMVVGASGGLMGALAASSPGGPAGPSPTPAAGTIRRSPSARPASERKSRSSSSSSSSGASSSTIRRSSSGGSSSGGSSTSSALVPSETTTIFRSATGSNVVRREPTSTATGGPGSSIFGTGGPAGTDGDNTPFGLATTGATGHSANTLSNSNSPAEAELIERIIDAIEERVIAELERRGRRHHPGVF